MTKSRYKAIGRITLWSVGVLAFLLIAGSVFLSFYLPGLIKTKIIHLVVDGSDSLYKCSIGKVSINFWRGNSSIENVSITVDSIKYKKLKEEGKLPNNIFEIKVLKGSINGLQVLPFIFSKKLKIGSIKVENANITVCQQPVVKKEPALTKESLLKDMTSFAKGIYVNTVLLNHIRLTYRQTENKTRNIFELLDCSVKLQNVRVDSIGALNESRIFFTKDVAIDFVGLNYFTSDSMYNLKIDSLQYSSLSKQVHLKNFSLKPIMTPVELTRRHGMQLDIFEVAIPELAGINFKMERIFANNELCFDTILLKKPIINIHRDRDAHYDTTSQYGKYPNEALANSPLVIRIPMVIIKDAELHYIERQRLTHLVGNIYFTKVSGNVTNITNNKEDIERENHCKLKLNGFFLHHGKLQVTLDMDLASPNGNYRATADMGPVPLKELNSVFVPFANVHLKSMVMHQGHIQFSGNHQGVTGSARLTYDDLKILILKPNPKTHKTKKQGFVSFFANIFVVRTHNRVGKREVIVTGLHVDRKRRQPFGNLAWEFVFESLKKIVFKAPTPNIKVEM